MSDVLSAASLLSQQLAMNDWFAGQNRIQDTQLAAEISRLAQENQAIKREFEELRHKANAEIEKGNAVIARKNEKTQIHLASIIELEAENATLRAKAAEDAYKSEVVTAELLYLRNEIRIYRSEERTRRGISDAGF